MELRRVYIEAASAIVCKRLQKGRFGDQRKALRRLQTPRRPRRARLGHTSRDHTPPSPTAMDGYHASAASQPSMSLSDILQQSRKLTNQLARDSDLPAIQLGIDQIESQSRKLVSKNVRSGNPSADARAYVPTVLYMC